MEEPYNKNESEAYNKNESDADEFDQTVTLTDETGRQLECYLEQDVEVEGETYVLLVPVDTPVSIFTWPDEEEEEPILVDDDQEIEEIFDLAKAVLSEQNLILKRTAVALTVEGEIPELDELEDEDLDSGEEERDEYQMLASFYCNQQEYAVYTPLDPLLILARVDENGEPKLLSPEEFERLEPLMPQIEDQLFNGLE